MFEFKKTFTFENRRPFEKNHVDQSGIGFVTRESSVTDSFSANVRDVVSVPAWVLSDDLFKLALADGNIVEVFTPVFVEEPSAVAVAE